MSDTIKIGVSACLLGESVRHDRGNERDPYLTEFLAKYVEFIPLCPEMACGMGVPREPVRQVDCAGDIRLIGSDSAEDWTDRMDKWCQRILIGLEEDGLAGFILKNRSPTCGMMRSPIYSTTGKPPYKGPGFFAARLMDHFPLLPVEGDDRLNNPLLRENFIRRAFVMHRWNELLSRGMDIGRLVDFHTRHKMLIRAHDLRGYRQLGRLLGESCVFNCDEIFDTYGTMLFKSLMLKMTNNKVADVLMHAMGFFIKDIDAADKQEMQALIHAFKRGKIPLLVPVTLLNHFARKYERPYLRQQFFLNPHPAELKLLNHV